MVGKEFSAVYRVGYTSVCNKRVELLTVADSKDFAIERAVHEIIGNLYELSKIKIKKCVIGGEDSIIKTNAGDFRRFTATKVKVI